MQTGTGKCVQRILVFDNNPDSLRLVFGCRAEPKVEVFAPRYVGSGVAALVWSLVVGLLILMLCSLSLSLQS
jgi:hypothetical protein